MNSSIVTLFALTLTMLTDVASHRMTYAGEYWYDLPLYQQNEYINASESYYESQGFCYSQDINYYRQNIQEFYILNQDKFGITPLEIMYSAKDENC